MIEELSVSSYIRERTADAFSATADPGAALTTCSNKYFASGDADDRDICDSVTASK